jgi:hypothetical protein
MRTALATIALCAAVGSGCSTTRDGPIASLGSPIAYGTADTTHTAVVALLSPVNGTELQECSGSVVGVSGGHGFVLTAAHCCNTYPPTVVVLSSNYTVGEQYINPDGSTGATQPPVYPVVAGSVSYDPQYAADSELDHDFCVLQFSGAPSGTATLALPSASDGLQLDDAIEHLGYGATADAGANAVRRTGTDTVNLELTSLIMEWGQGGGDATPGTCDGDSGGPALLPAAAAQAQQVVVGVTSYGPNAACAQSTYGVASRVSSAMGSGGFIASYLAAAIPPSAPAPAPAGSLWDAVALAATLLLAGLREPARRRAG